MKILIINPYWIGDVLFTTPIIRALKVAYPRSFIGYWCSETGNAILKNNPLVDKTFPLSRGEIKDVFRSSVWSGIVAMTGFFRALRRERFDVALDFSLDHRHGLVAMLCGIKRRIGYDYRKRGKFLTEKIALSGYEGKHLVEYHAQVLTHVVAEPRIGGLELDILDAARAAVARELGAQGIGRGAVVVGIAPASGASWGKDACLKCWPAENFAAVADRLCAETGAKVVILGNRAEMAVAGRMQGMMRQPAVNLAGRTSIEEAAAIIDRLDLFIGNDGGLLHMAVARRKKTVSLYGPVDPVTYGPYPSDRTRHIVIRRELACSPCYRNFHLEPCLRDKECLRGIGPVEVYREAARLLTKGGRCEERIGF